MSSLPHRSLADVSEQAWMAMPLLDGVIAVRDQPKVSHEERTQQGWTCLTPEAAAQTPHVRSLWISPDNWGVAATAWNKRQDEQHRDEVLRAWGQAVQKAGWAVSVVIPKVRAKGAHRHSPDLMVWFPMVWNTPMPVGEIQVRTRFGMALPHRTAWAWAHAWHEAGAGTLVDRQDFDDTLRCSARWAAVQQRWHQHVQPRWGNVAHRLPDDQHPEWQAWLLTQWAEVRWDDGASKGLGSMERAFNVWDDVTMHERGLHDDLSVVEDDEGDLPGALQVPSSTPATSPTTRVAGTHQTSRQTLDRLANFERFEEHFPLARSTSRTWTFFMGPPNTGKTYRAFERLAAADDGAYWAPLRLLALEGHETLLERDIPNHLLTGEERRFIPGSRHTASTVEMANPHRPLNVAVLDEVQLWQDPGRGWAWTQALLGAPACDVILTGGAAAFNAVQHLAQHLGDTLETVPLVAERVLHRIPALESWRHVRPGDALIAFSRRDVLAWKEAAEHRGFKVAVIYGHLSPEVRQEEARRFRDGEAHVLVATDAIGLGLNLPIKRAIFTAVSKFDGDVQRTLKPEEATQIAERAGRRGVGGDGAVTTWFEDDWATLNALLDTPLQPPQDLRWWVQPLPEQLLAWQKNLGGSLSHLLDTFVHRMLIDHPVYKASPMIEARERAGFLGKLALPLMEQYAYARAPVDANDEAAMDMLFFWANLHAQGKTIPWRDLPRWNSLATHGHDQNTLLFNDERRLRIVTLYRSLAQRFPDVYTDLAGAQAEHTRLNRQIEALLHDRLHDQEVRGQGAGVRRTGTR